MFDQMITDNNETKLLPSFTDLPKIRKNREHI